VEGEVFSFARVRDDGGRAALASLPFSRFIIYAGEGRKGSAGEAKGPGSGFTGNREFRDTPLNNWNPNRGVAARILNLWILEHADLDAARDRARSGSRRNCHRPAIQVRAPTSSRFRENCANNRSRSSASPPRRKGSVTVLASGIEEIRSANAEDFAEPPPVRLRRPATSSKTVRTLHRGTCLPRNLM